MYVCMYKNTWKYKVSKHLLTLGNDALHTNKISQKPSTKSTRGDMFIPKASLKTNMELVKLFGICCINGGNQVLQSSLECKQLTEGILQKSVENTKSIPFYCF